MIIKERFPNKKEFYEFHNIFDNQEFIDIEDEKSEYDFQRIKFILNEFIEERNIATVKIVKNVPLIRNQFVERCMEESKCRERKLKIF